MRPSSKIKPLHYRSISRNYDFTEPGFSPLPLRATSSNQLSHWTKGLKKDFIAIFLSAFLSSIGYGILMVMIALKLEANVKNEILISLSTTTQIGSGVIFARFLPIIGRKIGMINSIYIGTIIAAICSLLLYFYVNYSLWLLMIFFTGTSFFIQGVVRNTMAIDLAPNHSRAMIISIGTTILAVGASLGPLLINIIKTSDNFSSFAIASIFFLISLIPLRKLKKVDSNVRAEKAISIWRYVKNSPKIMLAGFSVSYAMASTSAFLIIYGIQIGLPKDQALLLLSVLLLGTIFYIPLGYLTDILNRRFMIIASTIVSLICAYILAANLKADYIHLLSFLLFGALAGIKLPAIVLINEKYKPTQRLAVNSAFSKFSLIGNICGLFATGALMKLIGPQGLWVSIILILSCFLFFCCFNYFKKITKGRFTTQDFSILKQKI